MPTSTTRARHADRPRRRARHGDARAARPARSRFKARRNDFADDLTTVKQALSAQARDAAHAKPTACAAIVRSARGEQGGARTHARATRRRRRSLAARDRARRPTRSRVAVAAGRRSSTSRPPRCRPASTARRGDETLDDTVPSLLVAINGGLVKVTQLGNASVTGDCAPAAEVGRRRASPGTWQVVTYATPEANRRVNDREVSWLERLREKGAGRERRSTGRSSPRATAASRSSPASAARWSARRSRCS